MKREHHFGLAASSKGAGDYTETLRAQSSEYLFLKKSFLYVLCASYEKSFLTLIDNQYNKSPSFPLLVKGDERGIFMRGVVRTGT